MDTGLITAVAGLWKLAAVVLVGAGLLAFRRPLSALFERFTRVQVKRDSHSSALDS